MANPRTAIIKAIEAKLGTVARIKSIALGAFEPTRYSPAQRPVVGIIPRDDDHERSSKITSEGRRQPIRRQRLTIDLRVAVDDTSERAVIEVCDLLAELADLMESDKKWGGLAIDTLLIRDHWLDPDQHLTKTVADQQYTIEYERS